MERPEVDLPRMPGVRIGAFSQREHDPKNFQNNQSPGHQKSIEQKQIREEAQLIPMVQQKRAEPREKENASFDGWGDRQIPPSHESLGSGLLFETMI
jgi:hypothetical protein